MFPQGERRQRIRHKLHTPVYATFSGPNEGVVLDLSELLDLHEDGFAVRTSDPLELNRAVNVCLDLPETMTYVHGTGHVVWSDAKGRAGVRLSGLTDPARRSLREWLFINLLTAATNSKARAEQLAHVEEEQAEQPTVRQSIYASSIPVPDLTSLLFAVDAVRRELRSYEGDLDAVFQFVTERSVSLTGATGAALAMKTGDVMVCRATSGGPAPSLQSVVDAKRGFSGECIRTACTTTCEDAETDGRVDREICQRLGIRSIMATPVFSDVHVVGLLEVFSPNVRAFAKIHEIVLEKLAELVPSPKPPAPEKSPPIPTPGSHGSEDAEWSHQEPSADETEMRQPVGRIPVRRVPFGWLIAAVAVAALTLGYVLAPTIEKHWITKPETAVQAASTETSPAASTKARAPMTLQEVRRLAEKGDADAQWNLGGRYHDGDGVPQDDAMAVQWFLRAAEQGHVIAQATLGAYYWAGRGVPQDLTKAYFWSSLALARGDEGSKSRLEGLASQMTRAQITAARQQAEEWIRQQARNSKSN
jgi:TPR repeat protein